MAGERSGQTPTTGGGSSKGNQSKTGYLGGTSMSAEDLNSALRADIGTSYMQGPSQTSYVGMGPQSRDAALNIANTANNSNRNILDQAWSANRGLLASGGLSGPQNEAIDYTRGVMQGGMEDEAYQRLRQNAIDDTRTAVNRQFGASGRFGAGSHVRDLGEGIADAAAGMDYKNLQRRDNAARGLFDMGQTGQVNVFGAMDRAPGQYENMFLPYQTQLKAYGLLDTDDRARAGFDPQYEHLLKYQGLMGDNAMGPQPAKQPGFLDYAGLGLGLLGSFL